MKIITLYTCDEWRSNKSMTPYWMGTDISKFYKVVRKGIEDGTFDYYSRDMTREEMLEQFDKDSMGGHVCLWDYIVRQQRLIFGHVTLNENNSYC